MPVFLPHQLCLGIPSALSNILSKRSQKSILKQASPDFFFLMHPLIIPELVTILFSCLYVSGEFMDAATYQSLHEVVSSESGIQ